MDLSLPSLVSIFTNRKEVNQRKGVCEVIVEICESIQTLSFDQEAAHPLFAFKEQLSSIYKHCVESGDLILRDIGARGIIFFLKSEKLMDQKEQSPLFTQLVDILITDEGKARLVPFRNKF